MPTTLRSRLEWTPNRRPHADARVPVGEGAVAAHEQAPPDQRADAAKDDAQLVDNGFVGRFRFRHVLIVRPDSSRPPLPRFFPLSLVQMPLVAGSCSALT
jgi:hypothetical protein